MKRFGTFEGVFVPSLLSILGVIMYLRLGWVVGSVGLAGALLIILISNAISLATGLSVSSTVTNIRIGHGGAYSIITKSLGVEAGGAIGIPLYLSQSVSVAFYITGFSECWVSVFPHHPILAVSLVVWLAIWLISTYSARLAFRIQFGILTVIALSLVSIFAGGGSPVRTVPFLQNFSLQSFLAVFAVFFPAVTGILAGVTMSGELKDPRRSIPVGTLGAILVSLVIYMTLAVWIAGQASAAELTTNMAILIDMGRWRTLVIAGIMGATLSSALNMFVTSPRTLFALGRNKIIPLSPVFAQLNKKGEPRAAILFTALITLITLMAGTLDEVANILTMIFLITYGTLNFTVFIEQSMGIPSFRPTFRIPKFVPFLGSVGCVVVMFMINALFTCVALVLIALIYGILVKRESKVYSPDVRSGMLTFMAEQMAKAASRLPYHPKIWKPNLMVLVKDIGGVANVMPLVRDIIYPSGRAIFVHLIQPCRSSDPAQLQTHARHRQALSQQLLSRVQELKDRNIFVETAVVETLDFFAGAVTALQTVKGSHFPPNTLFYVLDDEAQRDQEAAVFLQKAEEEGMGLVVLKFHPSKGLGKRKTVNLWIRRQSPNADLSILMALQLDKNWEDAKVRLIQMVDDEPEREKAHDYLRRLSELVRLPGDVEFSVSVGQFAQAIKHVPAADVNIFGMSQTPNLSFIRRAAEDVGTSVLFLRDSKHESVIA